MPLNQNVNQPLNFVIDPVRDGVANILWKAVSGTLALAGTTPDRFRFNTDDAIVRADLLYGVYDFAVRFPTTGIQTPTNLTNDIAFGLKNASMGNLGKIDFFVDQSGNSATFRTYDEFGTVQSTTITWDTDWNNALTVFRFGWSASQVSLDVLVNGETSFSNLATHETRVPNKPLNPFVNVVGGDNFDVDFIAVKNAQSNSIAISGDSSTESVDVASITAGDNLIGNVGIGVRTSGGTTPYKNLDVDETEDEVKGTAGQLYWLHVINLAATKRYLKFYNATAANVTVGTTTPVLTLPIPTLGDTNGAGFNLAIPNGIAFGTAITIAATTGFADNDTGAPGANEVIVNLGYA